MKRKLVAYGAEIFDTYELLEMLLYSVIPVKDTNPIAKTLLMELGDLEGVLSAAREDLISVRGVGSATANYIATVGALRMLMPVDSSSSSKLADYGEIGEYIVGYCKDKREYVVSVLLLDNSIRPIRIVDVYSCDYGKGNVQCKPFLDLAISLGASAAVIFHNHPFGPLFPSQSDIVTHKVLIEGFKRSGITLLDHFLVSGNGYARIGRLSRDVTGGSNEQFGIVSIKSDVSPKKIGIAERLNPDRDYLEAFLGYSISEKERCVSIVDLLMERYHSIENILSRECIELQEICGNAAYSLKLLAYITSRRYTDGFRPGNKLGDWISDYFKWYYFGMSVENVSLALFDKNKKLISVVKISEGTVNASNIVPRRAMEAVTRAKASYAVLAHNHPGGTSMASGDDVYATAVIARALDSVGVELLDHFVVAGMDVGRVEILDEIPTEG
jgi:DNA repair protein RadC